ncbi:MAG: PfkB family carbohydrate kinase, partial [Aeromonadaceae bacterium]
MNRFDDHRNSVGTAARPIVWSVAGSDSGGGAGLQADLLTCHDLGAHGCSVVSAVTAQNSCAVRAVEAVSLPQFVAQLQALREDLPATAIKIGLLPRASHLVALAEQLALLRAAPTKTPFVIYDPVAIASTGHTMADDDLLPSIERLFPHLDLLTPNGDELHRLTGIAPTSAATLIAAVQQLLARGVRAVLVKGGHL